MLDDVDVRIGKRILSAAELKSHCEADAVLEEAKEIRAQAQRDAVRIKEDIVKTACAEAERERDQIIMRAEFTAQQKAFERLSSLEPEITELVYHTVKQIIGELDDKEALVRATSTALERLKEHRQLTVKAAADVVPDVYTALERAGIEDMASVRILVDRRLDAGRILLTTEKGHAVVDLEEQVEAALAPWRDASSESA